MYEEILVDKVVCSEWFCISDCEKNIKIEGIVIPEGSTAGGTIKIAVLECTPAIDKEDDIISVRIKFYIQKDLVIKTQDCREIRLEYEFTIEKKVYFKKCTPCRLYRIDPCLWGKLECRVFNLTIEDNVMFHPSSPETPIASFDDQLIIGLQLKLVQQRQLTVPVCPPRGFLPMDTFGFKPCFLPFAVLFAFLAKR